MKVFNEYYKLKVKTQVLDFWNETIELSNDSVKY